MGNKRRRAGFGSKTQIKLELLRGHRSGDGRLAIGYTGLKLRRELRACKYGFMTHQFKVVIESTIGDSVQLKDGER